MDIDVSREIRSFRIAFGLGAAGVVFFMAVGVAAIVAGENMAALMFGAAGVLAAVTSSLYSAGQRALTKLGAWPGRR